MRVLIASLSVLLFFPYLGNASFHTHLSPKHQYAILTDDYGILTDNDVLITERIAKPVPFNEHSYAYSYWQCFPSKDFHFKCTDESEDGNRQAIGGIDVLSAKGAQESYVMNGVLPEKVCELEIKKMKRLSSESPFSCIAGRYINQEIENVNGTTIVTHSWAYDRIKTKKGCLAWFSDYCDLKSFMKSSKAATIPTKNSD